jgi:hypothetical protein
MDIRRIIFWSTIAAGAVAAWLMYRRGESLPTIAKESIQNPVGSFVREAQEAL